MGVETKQAIDWSLNFGEAEDSVALEELNNELAELGINCEVSDKCDADSRTITFKKVDR